MGRVVYNKIIIIAGNKSKYALLYFCSPFSAGFLSQSNRSSNLHNSIITEEAMDTAGVSGAALPVASQGFVLTERNMPAASKSGVYLPYRETDVGPSESSLKVVPAFAELPPHAGHCVEAYPNQMQHTVASVAISQKPQVFHTGNAASSAAASEAPAFRGIPGATFGGGHQMLQPVYPGMVMPRRVPYSSPSMPIAYQKPQVFPGLSNKPPHL